MNAFLFELSPIKCRKTGAQRATS